MYALVDGNNFYVSCERVFRPDLNGRPVVTLSNNDGCAIARSNEAKALGIRMGAPWFQIQHLQKDAGLVAFSANFALYGDMSRRMMRVAAGLGPFQEIYSIDESFIGLQGVSGDLGLRSRTYRDSILRWTGIPCGVGIGATKTLAKFANYIAKTTERQPGRYPANLARVCNLATLPRADLEALMAATDVGEVWGVGRQIGRQLKEAGVNTVLDLTRLSPSLVRTRWSVVLERTVRELQGEPCLRLDETLPAKQQIACARSFGRPVTELNALIEAVSTFVSRAAEKLRQQRCLAGKVQVFAHTSPFREGPGYSQSLIIPLRRPTSDTRWLIHAAVKGITQIYQPGFEFAKAGVMLLDLISDTHGQHELDFEDHAPLERVGLMTSFDAINTRFGQGTVHMARTGMAQADRQWVMCQAKLSPSYTTCWSDLLRVRA